MPAGYIIIFIRTNCRAKQRHICTRGLQQPLIIRDFNCGVPSLLSWQPGTDFFLAWKLSNSAGEIFFLLLLLFRGVQVSKCLNALLLVGKCSIRMVGAREPSGFVRSWISLHHHLVRLEWFLYFPVSVSLYTLNGCLTSVIIFHFY